jgi:hypothetical protein
MKFLSVVNIAIFLTDEMKMMDRPVDGEIVVLLPNAECLLFRKDF